MENPHLNLKESEIERLYQQYLKEGYYKEWAIVKAEMDVNDSLRTIMVDVPGVGLCSYSGD